VAHSAKVQAPQRHNSESVLYYEASASSGAGTGAGVGIAPVAAAKPPPTQRAWNHRVERNNQWNSSQLQKSGKLT